MFNRIRELIRQKPEIFVYLYFLVVTGFFAYSLQYGVVPDEAVHFSAIDFYSQHTPQPIIKEQSSNFSAGDLTRNGSFLYYYLLGFFYNVINDMGINPLIPIRLTSVLFGMGTLVILNLIGLVLSVEKKARLTLLFLIANTPMFIIISAGVNYDSAVIFLATLTAYLLLFLSKKITILRSLLLLSIIVTGPIIKLAFAPISIVAFLYFVFLLVTAKDELSKNNLSVKNSLKNITFLILITVIFLFSTVMLIEKYGGNYKKYGALSPACDQVLSSQQCEENIVYKRSQIYKNANLKEPELRTLTYISQWYGIMIERTYGVLAHRDFSTNRTLTLFYLLLWLGLLVLFIRKFRLERGSFYISAVTIVYTFALIMTNIASYKMSQEISLAVQGRYLFPVSFVFMVYVISLYKNDLMKLKVKSFYNYILLSLVLIAVLTGPINIKQGTNETWYRDDKNFINIIVS